MNCGYHTVGVIYDTVKSGNHSIFGVINTSQCHILHHIFTVRIQEITKVFCHESLELCSIHAMLFTYDPVVAHVILQLFRSFIIM